MQKKQYNIELSDEAEEDFDVTYVYYTSVNEKLADDFYKHVNRSLEKISINPFVSSEVYRNIRKFVIKKYSFVIYFQVEGKTVKVIAIFHTSRNPEIWNERTKI